MQEKGTGDKMKKRNITAIIAAFLVAGTAMAETPIGEKADEIVSGGFDVILDFEDVGGETVEEIPMQIPIEEVEEVPVSDDGEIEEEIIADKDVEPDFILTMAVSENSAAQDVESIRRMAVFEEEYNLSPEEKEEFVKWISSGMNAELLTYIYEFWLSTNEDFSMIKDIYDVFVDSYYEGMQLPHNHDLWFEGIFNTLTGGKCGRLTAEEIDEFLSNGISIGEIKAAERMSRTGILTVNEILSERTENVSWNEIAAEVYDIPILKNETELALDNILDLVSLTRISGKGAEEILEKSKATSIEDFTKEYFQESRIKADSKLKESNIIESAIPEAVQTEKEPQPDNEIIAIEEIL